MKNTLLIVLIIGIHLAQAQSVTPIVISSSGGFYANSSAQLSFTTAEMTIVQTFTAGSSILTQGFQQPFDFGVYVLQIENSPNSFGVYPNPGSGVFNLSVESKTTCQTELTVYDAIGKEVLKKPLMLTTGKQVIPLSLSECCDGMYILELIIIDGTKQNFLFQKIQLIK